MSAWRVMEGFSTDRDDSYTRRTTDSALARATSSFHSGTLRILEQRCPNQQRPTRRPTFRPTRTGGKLVSCLISLQNWSVLRSPSGPYLDDFAAERPFTSTQAPINRPLESDSIVAPVQEWARQDRRICRQRKRAA